MKTPAFGVLALTVASAAARAEDPGWSGLDLEIESLSASLQAPAATGPKVSGYIMTSLDYEAEPATWDDANDNGIADPGEVTEGEDVLGWKFRFVRFAVSGNLGHDYSYLASFELSSGEAAIRDAFVSWKLADGITARWGRYKVPFVRSALVGDTKKLFLDRTNIANQLNFRDLGVMASGQFDKLGFVVNAQNGSDGPIEDMFYNARATFDVLGDGLGLLEGAYGAGDALELVVGAAIGDDSGIDDGVRWIAEAALTSGPLSFAAEYADFGADVGDNSPWDATASYLISDEYELAARYEDYDTDADETSYSLGVNRYVAGHDLKWTLQYVRYDTDTESPEGIALESDQVSLGLTVAF